MQNLMENVKFGAAVQPDADALAGTVYSDVFMLENYSDITFLLTKGEGATGTTTITVEACDDTTPTNTQAMVFDYSKCTTLDTFSDIAQATTAGFATTAGANQLYAIHVNAEQVRSAGTNASTSFEAVGVRLKMVELVDSPCDAAVIAILDGCRFKGPMSDTPTAIA